MAANRSNEQIDRANRVRQAAMRADAFRSLMPLVETETAVRLIIERRLITGDQLPRGAVAQLRTSSEG